MRSALLAAVAFAVASCGVKEDVTLSVYVRSPVVAKASNPFGFKLEGSAEVVFEMGAYGNESAKVEFIQLGLYRGATQIVPKATIEPQAGTSFPFDVGPGQRHVIKYTIKKDQLLADEIQSLCAGPVSVTGTAKQAGKGEARISSGDIAVGGCP